MLRMGLLATALLLGGCGLTDRETDEKIETTNVSAHKGDRALQQACASAATYDRLKELAFDEAARIRGDEARALDSLSGAAMVRMENPVVVNRDEEMNVTICSGRFVLELPPGSENAFDGDRRLTADIEYAAQNAADGSGLVYQMEGAEPIIYRLATIGGLARGQEQPQVQAQARPATIPQPSAPPSASRPAPQQPAPQRQAQAQPQPSAPQPRPEPRPVQRAEAPAPRPQPANRPAAAQGAARPSFNCRSARTRTERMVCGSGGLAAQDRRMASAYYAELANADPSTRQRLRQTRDRFLARRERCGNEACVSAAYAEREAEIRAIAGRE